MPGNVHGNDAFYQIKVMKRQVWLLCLFCLGLIYMFDHFHFLEGIIYEALGDGRAARWKEMVCIRASPYDAHICVDEISS